MLDRTSYLVIDVAHNFMPRPLVSPQWGEEGCFHLRDPAPNSMGFQVSSAEKQRGTSRRMLTAQSMDWTIEPQGVPEMFMDSN